MGQPGDGALTFGALGASEADLDDVLSLNQHWVPHVGALDRARLSDIVDVAEMATVARTEEGELAGFVIVLGPGARYDSPNFQWFSARNSSFTYVDRIAVSPVAQGLGFGRTLYEQVIEHARAAGSPVVCAEVNVEPPNPESSAFHGSMGFVEVGRQWTYGDTVQVQLLERPV